MTEATSDHMDSIMGPEGDTEDLGEAVAKSGMGAYAESLQKKQQKWKTTPLNIAVIGSSGVGKSSLINAINNVTADDPQAAEVGCTKSSSKLRAYPHRSNDMLKLWDLPGVGEFGYPRETYCEKVQLERYDFFLLLSATIVTEIDVWIRNDIVNRLGKKFIYVRTKIGEDLRNHRREHPRKHNEDVVLAEIRGKIRTDMEAIGSEHVKVFLVDSYEQQKYDFQQLQQSLIDDFAEIKRQALILSLSAFSDSVIKTKANALRKGIWHLAALSAAVASIPIPGVSLAFDTTAALFMATYYHNQLGLDEISLRRHAQLTSSDPQKLLRFVSDRLGVDFLTVRGIKALLNTYGGLASAAAVARIGSFLGEEFIRLVPFVGSVVAGVLSFAGTYLAHKILINKLETVALVAYKNAVWGAT